LERNRHLSVKIIQNPLSYVQRLDDRDTSSINLVVIHCTELPDLATARQWGEKVIYPQTQTGNSGHFYIDRDGLVEQWVPASRVAHHVRNLNEQSIGIELVNRGRYPDWFNSANQQMKETYSDQQIHSLIQLLQNLPGNLPGLNKIAGHEDLDTQKLPSDDDPDILIQRKLDPGPLFPWSMVLKNTQLKRVTNII